MPDQSSSISNRSMPPGIIIPELMYPDVAAAVQWLCTVFGFTERLRIGNHRAQLVLSEHAAIIAVQTPNQATPTTTTYSSDMAHSLMVRVDNVDQHYANVCAYQATIVQPPTDFPYGERQYTVEDPTGRRWTFTQSIADIDPNLWGGQLREDSN